VIPIVVGDWGVPVPSVQLSFCNQDAENCPALLVLKIALLGAVAVSCNVTD